MKCRSKIYLSVFLSVFLICAPACLDMRKAKAALFGTDLPLLGTMVGQNASMLAQLASILSVLGIESANLLSVAEKIQGVANYATRISNLLQEGIAVTQAVQDVYYLEQSIERYIEYASTNFGQNGWQSSASVITQGTAYLVRATNEVVGLVDAIKVAAFGQSATDPIVSGSTAVATLNRIQGLVRDWNTLLKKNKKENEGASDEDKAAVAAAVKPGGFLNVFSPATLYTDQAWKGNLKPAQLLEPRPTKDIAEVVGNAKSSGTVDALNTSLISSRAETAKTEIARSSNMIVNAVRILIGLVLLAYTGINLTTYLHGGWDHQYMNPLMRVFLAMLVSAILLGILSLFVTKV